MKEMKEFIDETKNFNGELRNISNGLIADDRVTIQDSLMIGENTLTKINDFPVKDYVLK